ncbi:hypothetical protein [Plantactinospora sp. GCM10030261]|uniref:hypothetical protein n=1 Tax=Plantactinospora sp. GCM10030261 TaxID=3273420 RepID=UPI0036229BE0
MTGEARTLAEGYVYLELTMPDGETAPDYRRHSTLSSLDDRTWLLRFDGPYEDLWVTNEVTVDKAADREAERSGQRYGVGQSTLIDAGQWYAVEEVAATNARAGMARLAAGTADEETYWTVLDALAAAAAATEEIEKFIPVGAEGVPPHGFWTDVGRWLGDQRRDALRRPRLTGDRAFYRRQLDKVRAEHTPAEAGAPTGPTWPADPPRAALTGDPAGPTVAVEPAAPLTPGPRDPAPDTPLPARTFAEAYLFMDLCPCRCGATQFPRVPFDVLTSDADAYLARYAGPCDGCDEPREFVFRFPQRPGTPPDSPHRFSYPGDGPSLLLDPGDWVGAAEAYGIVTDRLLTALAEEPDEPTEDDRAVLVRLSSTAAYAVDEAMRFLPADAEAVPAEAFWTDSGREVHDAAPDRFDRAALTEFHAHRRRLLDEVVAHFGQWPPAPAPS